MSLISEAEIRAIGERAVGPYTYSANSRQKTAGDMLQRSRAIAESVGGQTFTVFLSHSYMDQILILGVKEYLEWHGHSVYVDWIDDRELDRTNVTRHTADRLRLRMYQSKCLLFATTENSSGSKWMPWELGYFDGIKNRAGILPLAKAAGHGDAYFGQEYLGIYPYMVRSPSGTPGQKDTLWMHNSATSFVTFSRWLEGHDPVGR